MAEQKDISGEVNREERPGYRYETCIVCRNRWNVSVLAEIPQRGYVCPHCMWRRT